MENNLTQISNEFEGKVALITGGARGIGQASAVAFARRGANIVVCDVDEHSEETISLIQQLGQNGLYVQTDVTDSQSVQNAIRQTISKFGRLDFAYNNAAVRAVDPVAELSEEDWRKVIDVNLTGVFIGMKYQIPEILKTKGAIVNTSSIWGRTGIGGRSAYAASKHGVIGLTKSAAVEYGSEEIRINAIAPGVVDTAGSKGPLGKDGLQKLIDKTPNGRPSYPSEIAEVVAWVCSPLASNINGAVLPIDGGWSSH